MKAKVRKFIRSSWMKLLQQVVIMGLALSLAGCAAVQAAQPTLFGDPNYIGVVKVTADQVIQGVNSAKINPNDYILVKEGVGYVVAWAKEDGVRVFSMILKTSDAAKLLPNCFASGVCRSVGIQNTFLGDGWRQLITSGEINGAIPILLAILTKNPGLISSWMMPNTTLETWLLYGVQPVINQ